MLTHCKVILKTDQRGEYSFNAASIFHGWLMESVSSLDAEILHETGLKPYSQFLRWEEDKLTWNINTCSEIARKSILEPVLSPEKKEIKLRHKDSTLPIVLKIVEDKNYADLMKEQFFGDGKRYIKIEFLSPVSFRSKGRYLNYPSLFHIYQSLMMKHDALGNSYEALDGEVLEELSTITEIIHYKLSSYHFHLEGKRIPSFVGEIGLRINTNQNLINFARFLFSLGEYTGVGIKTSLGMGAMRIVEKR